MALAIIGAGFGHTGTRSANWHSSRYGFGHVTTCSKLCRSPSRRRCGAPLAKESYPGMRPTQAIALPSIGRPRTSGVK